MNPVDAKHLITEIKKSKLSKWESGFVSSVSIQADQGRYLTSLQASKLQQIYRDKQTNERAFKCT